MQCMGSDINEWICNSNEIRSKTLLFIQSDAVYDFIWNQEKFHCKFMFQMFKWKFIVHVI